GGGGESPRLREDAAAQAAHGEVREAAAMPRRQTAADGLGAVARVERIEQQDEAEPHWRGEPRRRPRDRPDHHHGAGRDRRPSRRAERQALRLDPAVLRRAPIAPAAGELPPLEDPRPNPGGRPGVAEVADQKHVGQPDVVPVVERVLVIELEDDPERDADERDERHLGPVVADRRLAADFPDETVDENDVAAPGDRRVPRPERLDPRQHGGPGHRDDRQPEPRPGGPTPTAQLQPPTAAWGCPVPAWPSRLS